MQLLDTNPAALTELIRELGWLTDHQAITALSTAGEGNMNVVLRAQLAPQGSLIVKQSLPYVAKFVDIPAPLERIAAEVGFYQAVAASPVAERMPRLLGYAPQFNLCAFEDLGDGEDFTFLYQRDGQSTVPSQALLAWLGRLHTTPVDADALSDNLSMRRLNHEHIFDLPLRADAGLSFSPTLAQFRDGFLRDELRDRAGTLGNIYLGRSTHAQTHCLLHGDFYPGSWIRGADGEVMIIDPEFGFIGAAEFDVGVFLGHALMCGQTPSDLADALTHYTPPAGFAPSLAWQFAGIEVIRRILGVAQLPWRASDQTKIAWLQQAEQWLTQ